MEACMSRATKRLVPWRTSEEWREVYVNVYSGDMEKKRWACEILKNWKSRFTNDLSMGLKLSLLLTEAQLLDHDNHQHTNPPLLTQSQISTQYAYAITRFVNDLLESMQDRKFTISLIRLARKVGMPVRLVQLRHECTHGEMASAAELRRAAVVALMYLKKHYWEPQIYHYNGSSKIFSINHEDEEDGSEEEDDDDEDECPDDDDDEFEEEVVDEEYFRKEYRLYVEESMEKLVCEYWRSVQEYANKNKLRRQTKIILNSIELFLQADSAQCLTCIARNSLFLDSVKSSDNLPSEWEHLVDLVMECDLMALFVEKIIGLLGGVDGVDDDDDDEEEEEEGGRIEKVMFWCIVLLKKAKNTASENSIYERARGLLVEAVSGYNPLSQQLMDLLLPYCIPPLSHENADALKKFACELNKATNGDLSCADDEDNEGDGGGDNKDDDIDGRVVAGDKGNVGVTVGGDNDKQSNNADSSFIIKADISDVGYSKDISKPEASCNAGGINEIMFLRMDSPTIPKGIKSVAFYDMVPKVPVFKKRKIGR